MKISQAFVCSILLHAWIPVEAHTTNIRGVAARGGLQTTPDSTSERLFAKPKYQHNQSAEVHQFVVSELKVDDKGKLRWEDEGVIEEWATWPSWVLGLVILACAVLGAFLRYELRDWRPGQGNKGEQESLFTASEDQDDDIEKHTIKWQQYFALGFWYCLLIANAASTRLWCKLGIPRDCHERADSVRGLESLDKLLSHGFILAVMVAITQPDRFHYLFNFTPQGNFTGVIFLVVFFGTSPVYGSLDLIPALSQISLTSGGGKPPIFWVVVFLLLGGSVVLVLFHIWWAGRYGTWQGFAAYLGSRACVIGIYAVYFVEAGKYATMSFHMHHYMVGFLLAILAEFNQMLSLLLLAIGTGVFVQGLAAYNADPLIYRDAEW